MDQCLQQIHEKFLCEKQNNLESNRDQVLVIYNPDVKPMTFVSKIFEMPDMNTQVKALHWNHTNKLFEDVAQEVFCYESGTFLFECEHIIYMTVAPFDSEVVVYSLLQADPAQRVQSFGFDALYFKGGLDGFSTEPEDLEGSGKESEDDEDEETEGEE